MSDHSNSVSVDLEAAKERMEKERQEKIDAIDPKEVANRCMNAIRQMSPKLRGMEQREQGTLYDIKELKTRVNSLETQLEQQKDVFIKAIQAINNENKGGLFTWISKQFRRFLPNREKS